MEESESEIALEYSPAKMCFFAPKRTPGAFNSAFVRGIVPPTAADFLAPEPMDDAEVPFPAARS